MDFELTNTSVDLTSDAAKWLSHPAFQLMFVNNVSSGDNRYINLTSGTI